MYKTFYQVYFATIIEKNCHEPTALEASNGRNLIEK